MTQAESGTNQSGDVPGRRGFLTASSLLMAGGLTAAYGTFGVVLGRFVFPTDAHDKGWLFVCTVDELSPGEALDFSTPAGAKVVVARQGDGTTQADFLALSSVCPHLGCRVHWEGQNDRFFCPCHNGAFDKSGAPIAGPPKSANQALVRFPLKVENGLLFLEAPLTAVVASADCSERPPWRSEEICRHAPFEPTLSASAAQPGQAELPLRALPIGHPSTEQGVS